jgi:hypothetical protein
MRQPRPRIILIATGATLVLVAGSTTAYAAIAGPVDSSGVIHGCYTNKAINGTHVFVLQDSSTNCPAGTTAISWNQQGAAGPAGATGPQGAPGPAGAIGPEGPKGDTGAQGPAGPAGDTGPAGPKGDIGPAGAAGAPGTGATVGTEPPGANCTNGGVKVADGTGNSAYACTGAPGPAGPQGPAGVGTAGPSGLDVIVVSATGGIEVQAQCPADHPYVLGGGGQPEAGGVGLGNSGPTGGGFIQGSGQEITPGGWFASIEASPQEAPSDDVVTAYAICAK